jgi:hypothetical protein
MADLPVSEQPHWTLAQGVAWILFGDPTQLLPDRGLSSDEYALAEAEADDRGEQYTRPEIILAHPELNQRIDEITKTAGEFPKRGAAVFSIAQRRRELRRMLAHGEAALAVAIQGRKIVAWGKRTAAPFVCPTDHTRYEEIAAVDLLGDVVIGGPLCPPSESWLVILDNHSGSVDHAWRDVRIPADEVRSLFPNPLSPAGAGTAAEPVASSGKAKAHGGRKPKYDWSKVIPGLRAKLVDEGVPAPWDGGQARLEQWVVKQFDANCCPSMSVIRDKVVQEIKCYRKVLGVEAGK